MPSSSGPESQTLKPRIPKLANREQFARKPESRHPPETLDDGFGLATSISTQPGHTPGPEDSSSWPTHVLLECLDL